MHRKVQLNYCMKIKGQTEISSQLDEEVPFIESQMESIQLNQFLGKFSDLTVFPVAG